MPSLLVVTRRLLWIALLGLTGGVVLAWLRDRSSGPSGAPAEWPPLEPPAPPAATAGADTGADTAADTSSSAEPPDAPEAAAPAADTTPDTAPQPAADTTPDAAPQPAADTTPDTAPDTAPDAAAETGATWVEPAEDGSCPVGHPVKVKTSSGIFHLPGGRFYERTRADRCYVSAEAAEADGYRRSKS